MIAPIVVERVKHLRYARARLPAAKAQTGANLNSCHNGAEGTELRADTIPSTAFSAVLTSVCIVLVSTRFIPYTSAPYRRRGTITARTTVYRILTGKTVLRRKGSKCRTVSRPNLRRDLIILGTSSSLVRVIPKYL